MHAIVLFAHGSRDPRWREPIEAIARQVAQLAPDVPVRCAYLELVAPDLNAAVAELAALGASSIRVLPVFLGVGRHLREDLPRLLDNLRQQHADIAFTMATVVGEEQSLVELIAQLALKSIQTPS